MNPLKTALVLFLVIPSVVFAQPARDIEDRIDLLLAKRFPDSAPGACVLAAKDNEVFFRKAYGLADRTTKQKNSIGTIFRIGSITKQFTSTLILKLIQEGKLSLDDPLTKFFPDYPKGETITIQHLLTHTSGIKNYTTLPQIVGSKESKERYYRVDEIISSFKNQPMDFSPGEKYMYNNSGYFLLGSIIEKVTGSTWEAYLKSSLLEPLGMQSTFANDSGVAGLATGYYKTNKFREAHKVHPTASYAAGALSSTVDDLWLWNRVLFNGEIVRQELINKAWTPVVLNDGTQKQYGYGWEFANFGSLRAVGHGGTIDGFQAWAWYVPESKTFVAILSNDMSFDARAYTEKILNIVADSSSNAVK